MKRLKKFFEAIEKYNGKTLGYSHSRGSKELIQKIQEYYNKMGLHYEEDEIVITAGGSEAVLLVYLQYLTKAMKYW